MKNERRFYHRESEKNCQGLRESWIEFLSRYTWDWFCTFTFRGELIHPELADKKFHVLVSKINRALYGCRWFKHGQGIRWVRAIEMQKRDVLHYHALLAGDRLEELRRLTFMDLWHDIAGYGRIEALRSSKDVLAYVSKYVVKGGEIDLGGPFNRADDSRQLALEWLATPDQGKGIQGRPC